MSDLISRQAAIEVIDSFNVFESRSDQIKLEQMIGELPPALKKGKWIRNGWAITCSECGYDMPYTVRRFCPNCGADMREVTT